MTDASRQQVQKDPFIASYAKRNKRIKRITNRFSTYGFSQITTPTFEDYDLYMHMKGTVQTKEMVKTFDHTGNILALRSDVTIPITEQLIQKHAALGAEHRYFYVLDVFRHPSTASQPKERTQAGVECFGVNGVETDAEIVALAIHTLKDMERPSFKLEMGHAGFFEQCISALQLDEGKRSELKVLLQTKNMSELQHFLSTIDGEVKWKKMIEMIPLLYGKPPAIIERVRAAIDDATIHEQMNQFEQLYELLEGYNLAQHVVIDLSLMNHMDYYSDIIFQGFIHDVGKPVLMGGRYNELPAHFGSSIPAIGFACDVDAIVQTESENEDEQLPRLDVCIEQTDAAMQDSLSLATYLREAGWAVRTAKEKQPYAQAPVTCSVIISGEEQHIQTRFNGTQYTHTSFGQVDTFLVEQFRKEK